MLPALTVGVLHTLNGETSTLRVSLLTSIHMATHIPGSPHTWELWHLRLHRCVGPFLPTAGAPSQSPRWYPNLPQSVAPPCPRQEDPVFTTSPDAEDHARSIPSAASYCLPRCRTGHPLGSGADFSWSCSNPVPLTRRRLKKASVICTPTPSLAQSRQTVPPDASTPPQP